MKKETLEEIAALATPELIAEYNGTVDKFLVCLDAVQTIEDLFNYVKAASILEDIIDPPANEPALKTIYKITPADADFKMRSVEVSDTLPDAKATKAKLEKTYYPKLFVILPFEDTLGLFTK